MNDTTLVITYPTGATLYTQIVAPDNTVWNGTSYAAFAVASWSTFVTNTPETPASSGVYVCQFPTSSAAGFYKWRTYLRAGGSPASSDVCVGTGHGYWDGTTFGGAANISSIVSTLDAYNDLVTSGSVNDTSPSPTSFIGSSGFSTRNNQYRNLWACFRTGALAGIKALITSYDGGTKRFNFAVGFPTAPANGDTFDII